jgi:hypothetical protein
MKDGGLGRPLKPSSQFIKNPGGESVPYTFQGFNSGTGALAKSLTLRDTTVRLR